MNPGASTRTPYWVRDRVGLGHILIASLVVSILAISRESLWIDESYSAIRAEPDLASWWRMMMMFKGSELQMPLYMVYLWGWGETLRQFRVGATGRQHPLVSPGANGFLAWAAALDAHPAGNRDLRLMLSVPLELPQRGAPLSHGILGGRCGFGLPGFAGGP